MSFVAAAFAERLDVVHLLGWRAADAADRLVGQDDEADGLPVRAIAALG